MDNLYNKYEKDRNDIFNFINIYINGLSKKDKYIDFNELLTSILKNKSIYNFQIFNMILDLIIEKEIDEIEQYYKYIEKNFQKPHVRSLNELFTNLETKTELIDIINLAINMKKWLIKNLKNDNSLESWDIFLSHKYKNKFYNIIIYYVLTYYYHINVYVDWIVDSHVNRLNINEDTIVLLKKRLDQSNKMLFFNVNKFTTTNWMAWEVGYFNRSHKELGILDISNYCKGNTNIEVLSSNSILKCTNKGIYEISKNILINEWAKEKV